MQWISGSCASVALVVLGLASAQAQGNAPAPAISVGANVLVSKPFPKLAHYESWAAGDPDHAGRLLECAVVAHMERVAQGYHCYASFDNGKTWSTVVELEQGPHNGDPYVAYGRGDTVFVAVLTTPGYEEAGFREGMKRGTAVYRSVDGGKKWEPAGSFVFIDRESIVVDKTNGKYAGRVYVTGAAAVSGVAGGSVVHLYTSTDGGTTFSGPVLRGSLDGGRFGRPSNSVVLSDGTLAFLAANTKQGRSTSSVEEGRLDRSANEQVVLLTSTDGGETLRPAITVSEWFVDRLASEGAVFAEIAVDPGSRYFKDRLYAVWPDVAGGRVEIRFAYSADKGRTWSQPIRVNDDRPPLGQTRGPDHLLPVIGVNQAGVVLVAWYDRRESGDNMGWKIRAAASLDGGVTFTPSVPVSDAANMFTDQTEWIQGEPRITGGGSRRPNSVKERSIAVDLVINSFFVSGGHTSGLAVSADGVFHPAWLDNRTGVPQLWTAPVTVRGNVEKHGANELADLDDVTDKVALEAQSTSYDRSTNTLTMTARLRNTSKVPVRAPLKARVINLTSQLGVPSIVGAANGISTIGAIWDFGGTVAANGLLPDSTTATRTLTFRLSDLRAIRLVRESPGFTSGLVHFDVRVYGKAALERVTP